jgi:hypothetical protein
MNLDQVGGGTRVLTSVGWFSHSFFFVRTDRFCFFHDVMRTCLVLSLSIYIYIYIFELMRTGQVIKKQISNSPGS